MDLSKLDTSHFINLTHLTLVGDNATHIEHIEHYHTDAQDKQKAESGKQEGESGKQKAESGELKAESEELCHFIHPGIVDDAERLRIHLEVGNLVGSNTIVDICMHLNRMCTAEKILLPVSPQIAYDELRRMGMKGEDCAGFGFKNFCKYYRK